MQQQNNASNTFSNNNSVVSNSSSCNVRVVVRIRPLDSKERMSDCTECLHTLPNEPNQVVIGQNRSFTFDRVFSNAAVQEEIYSTEALQMIKKFIGGINVTIMAYGQTSSGKSYTMGTSLDGNLDCEPETLGIIPRAVSTLFESLLAEEALFELRVSFLELYNEELIDLFHPSRDKKIITIREDGTGGIIVNGVQEERINSANDVLHLLRQGLLCRTTGSTDMNLVSSRSHAIFTITLKKMTTEVIGENETVQLTTTSKLNFVDLAGSERLKRTNATGDRAKESISINSGLLALGNVISALASEGKKASHVPYRDSKLTRLLQDSLGGNSETLMITCVSPSDSNFMETLNSLKYANRARNIKNKVVIQQEMSNEGDVASLKKQIQSLKNELLMMKSGGMNYSTSEMEQDLMKDRVLTLETDIRQFNLTIKKLEAKIKVLSTELLLSQAQRDTFKILANSPEGVEVNNLTHHIQPVIQEYINQITELQTKIKEAKNDSIPTAFSASSFSLSRSMSDMMIHENMLEAEHEMRKNEMLLQNLNDDTSILVEDTNETLERIQTDIQLKEKLVNQIELNQKNEQEILKSKYEEKIILLQETLLAVQKERDSAFSKSSAPQEKELAERAAYEERMKTLEYEIAELRKQHQDDLKIIKQRGHQNESLVESMKTSIASLKQEKAKLLNKLKEESQKSRALEQTKELEIRKLKKQEQKANDQAKKLEKSNEHQKILLKRRYDESMAIKTKLKHLMKSLRFTKRKTDDGSDDAVNRPSSSPGIFRRRLNENRVDINSQFLLDDTLLGSGLTDITVKKQVFEREISNCVHQRQSGIIMEELVKKRNELAEERNALQSDKDKIADYLMSTPDASEECYKQLSEIEERLEMIEAEMNYLTNEKLKSIQNEGSFDDSENSYDQAMNILRSLTLSEAEEIFQYVIDEIVSLKIADKKRKITEGSLNKTISDLRHTLQLMRKAAVENAIDNEFQKGKKVEPKRAETSRGRRSMTDAAAMMQPPPDANDTAKDQFNIPVYGRRSTSTVRKIFDPEETSLNVNNIESVKVYAGHQGAVYSIAIDENSGIMYSASQDSTVKAWDLNAQGTCLQTLTGHLGFVRCLALFQDTLITGSQSIIRMFDSKSGKLLKQINHHTEDIESFLVHGDNLYASSSDSTVSIWDMKMLKPLGTLSGHKGAVFCLEKFQNYILTGSRDHLIKLYDSKTRDIISTLHPPHYDVVQALHATEDSLYSGSRDYSIKKWDLKVLKAPNQEKATKIPLVQTVLSAHRDWIRVLNHFNTPSGQECILSGSRDGIIRVWDSNSLEKIHDQKLHGGSINQIQILSNKHMFTASSDRTIKQWDISKRFI